jgi:hypothetical protein
MREERLLALGPWLLAISFWSFSPPISSAGSFMNPKEFMNSKKEQYESSIHNEAVRDGSKVLVKAKHPVPKAKYQKPRANSQEPKLTANC